MPALTTIALVAGGAQIAGGIAGEIAGSAGDKKAADARAAQMKQWLDLNVPNPEDQKVFYQKLVSEGKISPQQEANIEQAKSEMSGIKLDPRSRQAQMSALGEMKNIGQGGMRLSDQATLDKIMQQTATDERGRQEALKQEFGRRGISGAGMELGARQASQQAASQRAGTQGLDVAAQAHDRALRALMSGADLGGQMRAQDWKQQADAAESQNLINAFNASNKLAVQQRNVAGQNQAQYVNLENAQRIADANVGISNQQQFQNKGLLQLDFLNRKSVAEGMAGVYGQQAKDESDAAQAARDRWYKTGGGMSDTVASLYGTKSKKDKDKDDWSNAPYKPNIG